MRVTKPFHAGVLLATALVLAVAGCKSSSDGSEIPPTQSGMPEVVLPAKPVDQITAVVKEFFLGRGYTETESRHAYELVFEKPAKPGKSDKALRVHLRLQKLAKGWRLVGTPMGVESWHSDLETATVVLQGKVQIQGFLNQIKGQVEAAP